MSAKIENYNKDKATDVAQVRRILAAVDGSEIANKALEYAIDLARLKRAELRVIYAIGDIIAELMSIESPGMTYERVSIAKSFYEEVKTAAERWIQQLVEKAQLVGVETVNGEVLYGPGKSTVELIISYAKDNEIDLIVMGTIGKGTFKRLLLGSVASGVLNHAPCSVFVVR